MAPDWFTQVDFEDSSYDEHFQRIHNPESGYKYIQYLNNNLGSEDEIHGYAQVDLFRATMQYTEEFLIYFLSYINTEDNFVEDLIRNQVRTFCKKFLDGTPDEYFEDASFQFSDRLKAVFGYDVILAADDPASRFDDGLEVDQIEDYVTRSVEHIRAQLTDICRFYIDFIDMYNSTKHGNKFQISPSPTMEIHGEYTHEPDEAFASFLCKRSSEAGEGQPYLVNYPLNRLVDRSLSISEVTNSLFSYMNTVVEEQLEESTTRTKRFFLSEDAEEEAVDDETEDNQTIEVWNQDSKFVLPRTEELAEFVAEPVTEVAVRLSLNNHTVHVETMGNAETSDDYPILGTISFDTQPGPRLITEYTASFEFDLLQMDIKQYSELVKYSEKAENDELSQMVIKFDDTGVEVTEPIDGLNPPEITAETDDDVLESLALAQIISQTRLPLPPTFLEGQADVIVDSVQDSPQQDDVLDAIEEARGMGEGEEYTQILAEAPDDGHLESLQLFPGFIELEYSMDGIDGEEIPGSFREVCEDPDYDDPSFSITDRPGTYEQFVEDVTSLGLPALIVPRPVEEDVDSGTFSVDIEINYKSQTYWYDLHRVIIRRPD
ncbi:hypothetical protein [Haloarcula sp. 1CSR25-25]|uniref:hypothetical protein n=1 Tax=Haloarcula sp. 1CSR25-25 TaxID=2862545 RepID=UPI002893F8E6|nr:hypothetical protein [Haloarcula sp. 1CSR25-25]MDT3434253.1 hypothetical protein [Haloarcula sp. 1CSR25-25]